MNALARRSTDKKASEQDNVAAGSWHAFLAAWLGVVFDGMDASLFILILFPAVSALAHTNSHATVGMVGSIILATFLLGYALGGIVFGIASDYIGRKWTMVFTILLYALATGACALSHNWGEMAFYRFLVGLGIGGEISIGGVMVAEYWQGRARLFATGVMMSSFALGYLIAALVNLELGHFGWRCLLAVGVVPALLTLYVRSKVEEPLNFQLLKERKRRLKGKNRTELTADEAELLRFTLPELFARRNLYMTIMATVMASTGIVGYWAVASWIPPWINQLTGTEAIAERSCAAIVMNIGGIIACVASGFLVSRLGHERCFRLSFAGGLAACVGMFLTVTHYGPALLTWVFFVGAFTSMPFALLMMYLPELFEQRIRGTAVGFTYNFGRIIAAYAAIVGGQLIVHFLGMYALAGATVASVYALGFLASYAMPEHTEQLTPATTTVLVPTKTSSTLA